MGAKRTSTIGYERIYNGALQIKDREEFIKSLTTNMPGAPDHFSRCSAINGKGPALVRNLPALEELDPRAFKERAKGRNTIVLDTRSYDSFGGPHVPGSYHIDFGGNFATFAGWVLPPDSNVLLVTGDGAEPEEAVIWLRRVGLDQVVGYLGGGMFEWAKAGLPTDHLEQLSVEELHKMGSGEGEMMLVDVRAPREYEGFHIEGALNIPAPDLRTKYKELDPDIPTALVCSTGHRSSLSTSILKQHGFKKVFNVAGGMTGYNAAGYGPECPMCVSPHGPHFLGKKIEQ